MLPRVRAVLGVLLLLFGIPLLLAGGLLYVAMQHQDPAGGYSAQLHPITTEGHAVVVSDVDALLRREAPFARAGRTTLQLTARTGQGPAFLGLAPAGDAATYLTGVPFTHVDQVRLARGPLPVATTRVTGAGPPAGAPQQQPFWLASGAGTLEWSPEELRGRQLALVVMARDGAAPLTVELGVRVHPGWLASTTFGLLVLGGLSVLLAVAALAWPGRHREIVYVVPPTQLPEIAAHLGVPLPRDTAGPPAGQVAPGAAADRTAADRTAVGLEWPPAADHTPVTPVPSIVAAPISPVAAVHPRAPVPAATAAPAGSPAVPSAPPATMPPPAVPPVSAPPVSVSSVSGPPGSAPPVSALAAWLRPDAPSLPLGSWSLPLAPQGATRGG